MLESTGGLLKRLTKDDDLVGRYGGEEFAIFRRRASLEQTERLAERLRGDLSQEEFESETGATFSATASFGIAETDGDGESVEDLLNRADNALYESKDRGRNCVTVKRKN